MYSAIIRTLVLIVAFSLSLANAGNADWQEDNQPMTYGDQELKVYLTKEKHKLKLGHGSGMSSEYEVFLFVTYYWKLMKLNLVGLLLNEEFSDGIEIQPATIRYLAKLQRPGGIDSSWDKLTQLITIGKVQVGNNYFAVGFYFDDPTLTKYWLQ